MAILLRLLSPKLLQHSRSMAEPTRLLKAAHAVQVARQALCTESIEVGSGDHAGGITVRSPPDDIPYSVKGLSHIAIAVPDLAQAAEHYRSAFGAQVSLPLKKEDQGVTVVFVQLPNVCIELVHPLGESSPVAKFLQRNPKGGVHHICLEVDDITSAANYLSSEVGVRSVNNSTPTIGAEGRPILFLNPKDNHGLLIELQEANQGVGSRTDTPQAARAS